MAVAKKHGAVASFTCVEMRDCEHPPEAASGPEALLAYVVETAAEYGVPLTGENALQRYDAPCWQLLCTCGHWLAVTSAVEITCLSAAKTLCSNARL
jgi:Glycosyl hydrolase family 14